jgi:hypothetical protein
MCSSVLGKYKAMPLHPSFGEVVAANARIISSIIRAFVVFVATQNWPGKEKATLAHEAGGGIR